ncbi:MAG TPA: DinB family protein [Fimbriimonadaceae bacterium]|nr:DinB family protein [Fimbriimonadaceae bacterium]HRJ32442.1 DinB family protein [Fimbriimonadaceae bacterium]
MHGYGEIWHFTRTRLAGALEDLTPAQWEWRMHPEAHTIAEIVMHLAGAEHYWAIRLGSVDRDEKLEAAVWDAFIREGKFPYGPDERTQPIAMAALERTGRDLAPIIENPTPEILHQAITSPYGDPIDGAEGLRRIAQHAAYHTGQIWMIRMAPGFPA